MKTPDIEKFKKILKSRGLKATPQRLAVHSAMMELGHASADMVHDRIQERSDVKISVASVYNILSQLALMGVYDHRLSANNKMFFDINTARHIHLYDIKNHEFKDVEDEKLIEKVEEHFRGRRFKGYRMDNIDIQIICHPTRARKQ